MKFMLVILVLIIGCPSPDPDPVFDSGEASCEEANRNAGDCPELQAPGPDEDAGTADDIPFLQWCNDSFFVDKACIANAEDCAAAGICLDH